VYSPIALRDGKVAYISLFHGKESTNQTVQIQNVYIKDIASQKEIEVSSFNTVFRTIDLKSGISFNFGEIIQGRTYISQAKNKDLVVGISSQPHLTVFSPEGEKLYEIALKGGSIPVTRSHIRRFKEQQLDKFKRNPQLIKELEKEDFKSSFDEYLPLYREILTDEAGHLLVFRKDECFFDCPKIFEVYSSEGEYICETEIKTGDYKLLIERMYKHICFTKEGIIALVEPLNSPQFRLEIIKVAY
jgi:hypothetical protein